MNPVQVISDLKALLASRNQKTELSPQATALVEVLAKHLKPAATSRMARPTMEEISLHGQKIGLPCEECVAFFNFYEANGWRVGKNPMKNWHAAMANWRRNSATTNYVQDGQQKWNWRDSL